MTKYQSVISSLVVVFSILFFLYSKVGGKDMESPLSKGMPVISSFSIRVKVVKDGDIFTYDYTFSNPATSTGKIQYVDIDIHKPKGSVELSEDGLVNGSCSHDRKFEAFGKQYTDLSPQELKQHFPPIPVGIIAPDPWACMLTVYSLRPWLGDDNEIAMAHWGVWRWDDEGKMFYFNPSEERNNPNYVYPGQSLSGFQLTSRGLPAIREFHATPFIYVYELPIEPHGDGLAEIDAMNEAAKGARGQTLAPTAPPEKFDPLAFIETIRGYVTESQNLKWLKDAALVAKLKGHLDNAAKAIPTGNTAVATQAIKAFISALQEPPAITKVCIAECSGLLVFNAQYLLDRLSTKPPLKKEK